MSQKSEKPRVSVRISRMLYFLIGANLVILFVPRIGMIHDLYTVYPMLSILLTIAGVATMIWSFRTLYEAPKGE